MNETYLGDGLYGRVDEFGTIWLRAPRETGDHYVALEQPVFGSLIELVEHCFGVKITITELDKSNPEATMTND